jgi:hypothetical protein
MEPFEPEMPETQPPEGDDDDDIVVVDDGPN